MHPFIELQSEYASWVANCRPLPGRIGEIDSVAKRLTQPMVLAHLDVITAKIGLPQVWQAASLEREDNCDFTKNPGQGDPLTHPSTHVPRGRPPLGAPPNDRFPVSWEFAAMDAYTVCDRLDQTSAPWSMPYACYKWEYFNGGGYRAHGIRSPYVVGGTNLQQRGKYVGDGEFDPNHMDTQLGCLPIALRMIELEPRLAFGPAVAISSASIVTLPAVSPPPAATGGSLTGTKWVQASLNIADHIVPPLTVDGSFGRQTRAAVRKFQSEHDMSPTGYIDDAFCTAMDAALVAARPVA